MKRLMLFVTVLGALLVAATGCGPNKSSADAAIAAAQTSFDAVKDQAMNIAPDEAQAVQSSIDAAKASAETGEYKAAIDAANTIPAQVQTMSDGLAAKEAELKTEWEQMQSLVPVLEQFKGQVEKVASMRKLPAGIDAAQFEEIKGTLADAQSSWTEAQSAMASGKLAEAVNQAGAVKQLLAKGMSALSMPIPSVLQ